MRPRRDTRRRPPPATRTAVWVVMSPPGSVTRDHQIPVLRALTPPPPLTITVRANNISSRNSFSQIPPRVPCIRQTPYPEQTSRLPPRRSTITSTALPVPSFPPPSTADPKCRRDRSASPWRGSLSMYSPFINSSISHTFSRARLRTSPAFPLTMPPRQRRQPWQLLRLPPARRSQRRRQRPKLPHPQYRPPSPTVPSKTWR